MDKSPDAFRTISEVAEELDVPQHVLRFWETRFRDIKPMKRGGGRRYYRPQDVALLRGIRHLLYGEGYTIRGVQRILRDQGARFVQSVWEPGAPQPARLRADDDRGVEDQATAFEDADEDSLTAESEAALEQPRVAAERREPLPTPSSAPVAPAPRGLSAQDRSLLQDALRELADCRRMLDTALAEAAA